MTDGQIMTDGEILFVDAKFKYKKKEYNLEGVVYKHNKNFEYWNFLELKKKRNITEKVLLYDIKIISRLGFPNKSKGFVEAVKSNEKRNKISGQYD